MRKGRQILKNIVERRDPVTGENTKLEKNSSKFPVQFCQFLPRDGDRVRDL